MSLISFARRFSSSTVETEPGSVASFIIGSNGLVKQIDKTPSFGNDPAHLAVVSNGKEVIVPNVCTCLSTSATSDDMLRSTLLHATWLIQILLTRRRPRSFNCDIVLQRKCRVAHPGRRSSLFRVEQQFHHVQWIWP